MEGSKELLKSYGFQEGDFEGSSFEMNDPQIIFMSFAILEMERRKAEDNSYASFLINSCVQNVYASELWDCAKRAIGMDVAIEIYRHRELSSFAGRKRLIKTFTKIGARYLGWVGVGIATYDFIDCMWVE